MSIPIITPILFTIVVMKRIVALAAILSISVIIVVTVPEWASSMNIIITMIIISGVTCAGARMTGSRTIASISVTVNMSGWKVFSVTILTYTTFRFEIISSEVGWATKHELPMFNLFLVILHILKPIAPSTLRFSGE